MNEHVAAFVIFNTVYNLIFSYFIAAFLKNDHPIRQLFYTFIVLECILWPLSFSLNRQYILKQVVVFSSWLLSLRVLYRKESMMRVCLAFLIHSFSAAFIELILAMIFYLIVGNLFNYQNFMNVPVSFYLMEATAFLVIFTCCIRFASKAVFEKNRIFVCQFCLFGVQTLVFLFFCYSFLGTDAHTSYAFTCLYLLAIILMLSISFYQLIVANQKEQQQKSLLLLQKEYEKQLQEYLKISDNEQTFRELRHDLMNYIISNQERADS